MQYSSPCILFRDSVDPAEYSFCFSAMNTRQRPRAADLCSKLGRANELLFCKVKRKHSLPGPQSSLQTRGSYSAAYSHPTNPPPWTMSGLKSLRLSHLHYFPCILRHGKCTGGRVQGSGPEKRCDSPKKLGGLRQSIPFTCLVTTA